MNFTDILFIAYFLPASLLLYFACGFSRGAQNVCLLALSLVFYAWGEPLYLIPLLYAVLVNYGLGLLLTEDKTDAERKRVLRVAVVLNVGMLLFVRYAGPLAGELAELLAGLAGQLTPQSGSPAAAALPPAARLTAGLADWAAGVDLPLPPLGVSFFTLQALAYVFDVSRGKAKRETNICNVGLYIALFPTVLAGPILRFTDMASQIRDRRTTFEGFGKGSMRFVTGLAKLVLVASPLSLVAGHVFTMSAGGGQITDVPVMLAWLGLLAFGLQIYLTFSAYSDMALGVAGMFGFSIRENFRYPYAALTVTDFWKRWHISLFRWFHSYVYIPLGGSRPRLVRFRGAMRPRNFVVRNLFAVWLLIALWHGISWTFFLWGMWFFILFVFEWIVRLPQRDISSPAWRVYLLLAVGIGWVFFRSHSVGESMDYFANLLGLTSNGVYSELAVIFLKENWLPFLLGVLLCTPLGSLPEQWIGSPKIGAARYPLAALYLAAVAALFCLTLVYLTRTGHIPFVLS